MVDFRPVTAATRVRFSVFPVRLRRVPTMPQIAYPFSYLAEAFQFSALGAGLLALISFYVLPGAIEGRTSALVASAKKSPIEGFSVPLAISLAPASLAGGASQVLTLNIVGIYSLLTLTLVGAWLVGTHSEAFLITRAGAALV